MFATGLRTPTSMRELQAQMDDLFGNFFTPAAPAWGVIRTETSAFPALNVWETDESLVVEAELPGFTMENVDISLLGNELTIKGERGEQACEGCIIHRRERTAASFSRSVRLPIQIDPDRVSASLTNGVLSVRLAKAEAARPRKIEVKTS